jgi:hypothetical protein
LLSCGETLESWGPSVGYPGNIKQNDLLTYLLNYLHTYLLTYSMEHSPSSEANRFSSSQEIPRVLWNPKVHYHKYTPPVPILSQLDPVRTPTYHLLKICLSNILLSTPASPRWSYSSGFPTKTLYTPLLSSIRPTRPAYLILLDFINRAVLGE